MPAQGTAGVGVVIRDVRGRVLRWHCARAPARTCNEAEYQALIVGLTLVRDRYGGASVRCLSDSRVVVEQMAGRAAVHAEPLKRLYIEATRLARQFSRIEFVAIPRDLNRLADALAWEALKGRQWLEQIRQ